MEKLKLGGKEFDNRLIIGTGKYSSGQQLAEACKASGAQIATMAVKRVDAERHSDEIVKPLKEMGVEFMPNTSGAKNAKEAVFAARLAREALGTDWIKVEIHPDVRYLLPDPVETLEACETLVKEGFKVFPYIQADPVLARRLEEIGCAAVMPLGAPIGSARGLETIAMLKITGNEFKSILHPAAVVPVRINGQAVSHKTFHTLIAFSTLYIITLCAGVFLLAISGLPLMDSLGMALSSISNIGPEIGRAYGELSSWSSIPVMGKWVCSFLMLLGRLELFSIFVLFTPRFWKDN